MSFLRKYTGPLRTAARKKLSAIAVAVDAYFNYVTMLLHGDGTNGAQNNTFLDSSTNNFTITRNGNTTQGSFSPYGSNWSNYFNGSSNLNIANNAVFTLPANFTVECWFFQTGAFQDRLIISKWPTEYYIYTRANGVIGFAWGPYNASGMFGIGGIVQSGNNGFALNTWTHVAAVRNSNTFTLYINGVSVSTATFSTGGTDSGSGVTIGDYGSGGYAFDGYISNARIVKGTAVYTANFTPSTTPLTAITNTSLLTCQSNRFIDNSTNNFAITTTAASVQRFNPFGTATAYDTSVIGGSGYFDGTGDYLDTPDAASWVLGNNFTIECWVYFTTTSGIQQFINQRASSSNAWQFLYNYPNSGDLTYKFADGNVAINRPWSPTVGQWYHIAVTRSNNTWYLFSNGVQLGATATNSTSFPDISATVRIGTLQNPTSESFYGYISDIRVVKSSLYTSAFTPPTAPLTAVANTQLLLNYTNAGIIDNSMLNNLETVGNAQISTSVYKYGTGSLAFDGTGDYLVSPNMPPLQLGSGDFTIEYWIYYTSFSAYMTLLDTGGYTASNSILFQPTITSGALVIYCGGVSITESSNPSLNTWYHYALVRSASTATLYRNGTSVGSATSTSNITSANPFYVGGSLGGGGYYLSGYIDDLRITKGYARYTANFTAPTAAFSNTGPY